MTTVHVDLRRPNASGGLDAVDGTVEFHLYQRDKNAGGYFALVTSFAKVLSAGVVDVQLTPNSAGNGWVAVERVKDGATRTVYVPNQATVNYTDLPDVDPSSLAPTTASLAAWNAVLAQVTAIRDQVVSLGVSQVSVTPLVAGPGAVRDAVDARVAAGIVNKADLVGGVIPTNQMPALALTTVVTVANRTAMLNLTSAQVQPGDVAVDTSTGSTRGSYMLAGADPSQIANWVPLTAPIDVVQSVNGYQGTVVLAPSDLGAAPLNSPAMTGTPTVPYPATSDYSSAVVNTKWFWDQSSAVYAPLASPTLTGTPVAPTAAAGTNTTQVATTAFTTTAVSNGIASKANLASPAFTGTPTAPTPATADNTTTLATTAFVKAQGYLTSAPGATDATTSAKGVVQLAGDLAGTAAAPTVPGLVNKANLASPTFTGTPAAPTAAAGTNTTQIASTAFVTAAALVAQQQLVGINSQSASYTFVASDAGKLVVYNSTGAAGTFTIPTNASVAFPVGTVINLCVNSAGPLTIAAASGANVLSPAGYRITAQYAQASIVQIGANTWYLSGMTVV